MALTTKDLQTIKDLFTTQAAETQRAIDNLELRLTVDTAALRREIQTSERNLRKEINQLGDETNQLRNDIHQLKDEMNQRFDKVDQEFKNLGKEIAEDVIPLFATTDQLEEVKRQIDILKQSTHN